MGKRIQFNIFCYLFFIIFVGGVKASEGDPAAPISLEASGLLKIPVFEDSQTGMDLANQLTNPNIHKKGLMARIHDVGAFESVNIVPIPREDDFIPSDLQFQKAILYFLATNTFREGDLILSDTGHDIPVLYELLASSDFVIQSALHIPIPFTDTEELTEKNSGRILGQAQTYGDAIAQMLEAQKDLVPNLFYIGLEGHRDDVGVELNISKLPTVEELKAAGVKRVIYFSEVHPNFPQPHFFVDKQISPYLNSIKGDVEIAVSGLDCRAIPYPGRARVGCFLPQFDEPIKAYIQARTP